MRNPDCRVWSEQIVESARRAAEPAGALEMHLRACQGCRARWNAERNLGAAMGRLRDVLAPERSPELRRRQLMAEFAVAAALRRGRQPWWTLSPAAALVAIALLLLFAGIYGRHVTTAPARQSDTDSALITAEEADGYVAVPFTQPLAPGESVRIVRKEVDGAELAHMGFDVPGAYGGVVDADVVLGEDGMPRAVRLVGYEEF